MVRHLLVSLIAGAASALLFASAISGSLTSVALFYLAPLPIMIAALGWSHVSALVAAFVAASVLAVLFGPFFFLTFLLGVGLPAWWLGYLALLARIGPSGEVEWYPIGRLVIWAALISAGVVAFGVLNFSRDVEGFEAGFRKVFERILRMQMRTPADAPLTIPGISDPQRFIDILVVIIPLFAAALGTLVTIVNLWLAARIVRLSDRLRRPWPVLSAMTFPRLIPAVLALAVVGGFLLPSLLGVVSGLVAASLLIAYAILGFAVLHATTIGLRARGLILSFVYASVAVFGSPILLVSLLGFADSIFDIRGRVARRRAPTPPHT